MTKQEPAYKTEKEIFPKRLRELMEETDTTQEKLGEVLGVRRQTISLYASGQSKPDWTQLKKIALHFNVPADYLIGLTDNKKRENIEIGAALGLNDKQIEGISWVKNLCDNYGWNLFEQLFVFGSGKRFIKSLFSVVWAARVFQRDKEDGFYSRTHKPIEPLDKQTEEELSKRFGNNFYIIDSEEVVKFESFTLQRRFNSLLDRLLIEVKPLEDDENVTENNT